MYRNFATVQHLHLTSPIKGEGSFFPRSWWEGLGEGRELLRNFNPRLHEDKLFSMVWASPFPSRLAVTTGRIEFVIPESSSGQALRTSISPPVALHLISRCRSYGRFQVWKAFYLKGTFTPLALRTLGRTRG